MFLTRYARAALAAGLALWCATAVVAQTYQYTLIADTQPGVFNGLMGIPTINNSGRVAFWGRLASNNVSGVYVGTGGTPTLIVDETGPIGGVFAYGQTCLNDMGEVAFYAGLDVGQNGIFKCSGGPLTTIALTGPNTTDFAWLNTDPTINNLGRVSFSGATFFGAVEGVYTGAGGPITTIFDTFGPFLPTNFTGYRTIINDAGMTAFFVKRTNNTATISRGAGSGVITIYDNAGPPILAIQSDAGYNNVGRASFTWTDQSLVQHLSHGDGGPLTTVSNNSGPILFAGNSAISGVNRVAANVIVAPNGDDAIVTGPSPTANKVIKKGDTLFGRTVQIATLSIRGINDAGQVAFLVNFTDNSRAVVRATPVRPCMSPPTDMVLWLPFDEPFGPFAPNSCGGNQGIYQNGASSIAAGKVNRAAAFNGSGAHILVQHYPAIDIAEGDFSIHAWVRLDAPPTGRRAIVERMGFDSGAMRGYSLFLDNGRLACTMADAGGATTFDSGQVVPADGQWRTVALTVKRDIALGLRFFIDGAAAGPLFNPLVRPGSLAHPSAALRVGAETLGPPAPFHGAIDDVSIYRRSLGPAEVLMMHQAQAAGMCPSAAALAWDTPFCRFASSAQTSGLICNYSSIAKTYHYAFSGAPSTDCGSINGPVIFTPFGGTVVIQPGQCVSIPVTIARPSQMIALGQIGCYQMAVHDATTGDLFTVSGSVQDRRDLCIQLPTTIAAPIDRPTRFEMRISNTTPEPTVAELDFSAYNSQMLPDVEFVSINGLPPGEPQVLAVPLGPNEEIVLPLSVQFARYDPLGMYSLVVKTAGPGTPPMVAGSTMLRNAIVVDCYADCDQSTGPGVLDIFDFLCFGNKFAQNDPYACDCDLSTGPNVCDIFDFLCFGNAFSAGCS